MKALFRNRKVSWRKPSELPLRREQQQYWAKKVKVKAFLFSFPADETDPYQEGGPHGSEYPPSPESWIGEGLESGAPGNPATGNAGPPVHMTGSGSGSYE